MKPDRAGNRKAAGGARKSTGDEFVCVLRASCRRPGLGALLRDHARWKPDSIWEAGVPDARGRVPKTNGFSLCVAEGSDWNVVAGLAQRLMRSFRPMIEEGLQIGARFELDVGVMSEFRDRATCSTRLSPRFLALLVELGVELCVTTYPVQPG